MLEKEVRATFSVFIIGSFTVDGISLTATDRLPFPFKPVRNVFFEHSVEIGAAKTKSAQTGAAHAICRHRPWFQFGIDVKRRVGKIDIGIEMFAMHARRQYFVAKRQGGLQQSGGACRSFEVPEVRFD